MEERILRSVANRDTQNQVQFEKLDRMIEELQK